MEIGLKTRLDYDDYRAIPSDGMRYELIDGEVHVTRAPSPFHQRLVLRLARALQDHFGNRAEVFVAPVDVVLSQHDVVQPDIVVVANAAQVSERGIEGAPLLVVEVLSPATTVYDRTVKSQRYASAGVLHYWLLDPPTRRLECYRREGMAYRSVVSQAPGESLAHPDFAEPRLDLTRLWD